MLSILGNREMKDLGTGVEAHEEPALPIDKSASGRKFEASE